MPNKIRVLWFNHRDIKHQRAGGAERTIMEIGSRLSRLGFSITLYSVGYPGLLPKEKINGITVKRISSNFAAHISVWNSIKKENPDVIIDDMAHAVPWMSSVFSKKPVVVFFRHMHSRTISKQLPLPQAISVKAMERLYGGIYKDSVFVTESDSSASDLQSLGIRENMIKTILPGVDHSLFSPSRKTKNASMVYFSGLRDYKRPELSLRALEIALNKGNNASLSIIGSGPSAEKLRKDARRYKSKVSMPGRLNPKRLSSLVAKSWINLNFSIAEGFGYSMLEAASCGTPTIAMDAPGVSETVNKYGLGITIRSMGEFANAFDDITSNINRWSRKVHDASMKFNWDKSAKEWAKLLKNEAEREKPRKNKKGF